MPSPLAYFLTWTCYGTWLHGDNRGSVDDTHNAYKSPLIAPSTSRLATAQHKLRDTPFLLTDQSRPIVQAAIEDHCRLRRWQILALNIRSNHIHCVLSAPDHAPEVVMGQLKTWSTRRLREANLASPNARLWTREGSTRHLFDQPALDAAIRYTLEGQGPDLPNH